MIDRLFLFAAGLSGCLGVALSAMTAHGFGDAGLDIVARFLLAHAAALTGLAALLLAGVLRPIPGRIAGGALLLGLFLFCGELTLRAFAGRSLFPMAAPTGGFLMMGGWLAVAVVALVPKRP